MSPRRNPLPIGVAVALLVYAGLLVRTAWLCDDAYITFRTVENVLLGLGPVYNAGERVQTFTHPLWMLVLCPIRRVVPEMYDAALWTCLGLSLSTVLLLARSRGTSEFASMTAIGVLAFSRAFVDYSTSGLENPLTHFLLIVFLERATRPPSTRPVRDDVILWGLAGLLPLNRLDAGLLVAPWAVARVVSRVRGSEKGPLWPAFVGLAPIAMWESFALVYYGFPFPNSAYAKLGAGVPWGELLRHGLGYVGNSVALDPITPFAIATALLLARRSTNPDLKLPALGMVLYVIYVVSVGGDFMSGRFFSAPLLVAVWIWARSIDEMARPRMLAGVALGLGLLGRPSVFDDAPYMDAVGKLEYFDVSNERTYYYRYTGLLRKREELDAHPWVKAGRAALADGQKVHVVFAGGLEGYYATSRVHVIDVYGLLDPLVARLSMREGAGFRIGHMERKIPEGYERTIAEGRNVIRDHRIRDYADALFVAVHGPVFSARRFSTIWRLNTGDYPPL